MNITTNDELIAPWRVMIAVLPGVAMAMCHSLMLDVPRADVIDALDTDRYRIHWITGSYLVGSAAGMCLTQFATGLLGFRRAYLLGVMLFTLAGSACGLVNEIVWMTPLRLLQGIGNGQTISVGMVIVWRAFPRRLEWAMAAYGICTFVPMTLGAVAGGLMAWYLSWRFIFYTILPVGIIVGTLAWWLLPVEQHDEKPKRVRFDFLGFPLWVTSVATMNVMLDMAQYWGWIRSRHFVSWLAAFVLSFGGFLAWGLFARQPVINLRAFRHRNAALGLLVKTLFSVNLTVLVGLLATYMIDLRSYQWWQGAMVLLAAAGTMLLAVLLGLAIGTPENRKLRMFVGLAIMTAATVQLTFVDVFISKFWQAGVMAVWGFGAGLVIEPALVTIFEGLSLADTMTLAGGFNILRAVPAYVGLVLLSTFWVQDTDAYFDLMRQTVRYNTPIVSSTLERSRKRFITYGSPHTEAEKQSYALMHRWTHDNSRAFALQVVFRDLAYLTAPAMLLVLLIKRPTAP